MLSASHGQLPYGYGAQVVRSDDALAPRLGDLAAFAPQQQHLAGYDAQAVGAAREFDLAYGGFQDPPALREGFGLTIEVRSYNPERAYDSTLNQSIAGSPPQTSAMTALSEPAFGEAYMVVTSTSFGQPAVWSSYTIVAVPVVTYAPSKPPTAPPLQNFSSLKSPLKEIPPASGVLAYTSALTDSAALPAFVSRDSNSVATLTTEARDLAFQDYTPTLLLLTANSSYDRPASGSTVQETAQPEVLDGFIRPSDETIVDSFIDSTDALTQERDAVSAVLRELRDVNTPLPAKAANAESPAGESPEGQPSNSEIELWQAQISDDELPAGEVVDGMVMLPSSNDVNESGFDLAPVFADHLGRFDAQTELETSVGLYQAVDVAADESSAAESAPPMGSNIELQSEIKPDDHLQTHREQPGSSRKAAALIGATTLTGALLWIGRTGSYESKPQTTAKRRSARRG